MKKAVFLDTSFLIALISRTDAFHKKAIHLSRELRLHKTKIVTSWAIVIELGNVLAKPQHRQVANRLIESLLNDSEVEVIPISDDLCIKAWQLYKKRADKKWGMTDCTSFVVMAEHEIKEVLTADEDFKQAGFIPLLG
ncbi:MAG: type II toxin-antitoxin system VapC family toxin [Gammaproteobacteria bacterium]|nr:type II toxin-antitoxin system VapC family toxin [Gammaproteobacteria bacterium]